MGGANLSNIITNILKKLLSDCLAESFSYLGQRNKGNFSALKLCSILKSKYYAGNNSVEFKPIIL